MDIETCPVLIKTKTWQNLFGVRRGNFRAYRKFCKRRNKKIRKSLKVSFGKKFTKDKFKQFYSNPVLSESLTEKQGQLIVESILLMAEKNFVWYLESKSSASLVSKKDVKKKLRTALKFIDTVIQNFPKFMSVRTKGEFSIYRAFVASSLFLERKKFKEAKEELVQIIAVLGKLLEVVTAVEKAQMEELLESAKQNLRYCKFQLKEFDRAEEKDVAVIRNSEDVKELLDKVSKTTVVGMRSIPIFNKTIEIDDEQIVSVFNKEQLIKRNLAATADETTNEELFWELANIYEEGVRGCHKKRTEAGNNVSLSNIWSNVECLFDFQKNLMLFKRNAKMFRQYDSKFELHEFQGNADRRPQESIKQLETLLVHGRILNDTLSKFGQTSSLFNCFEKVLRAHKCMFVCQFYNKSRCFKESLSLAEHQIYLLKELVDNLKNEHASVQRETDEFDLAYNIGTDFSLKGIAEFLLGVHPRISAKLHDLAKQSKVGLFDEGQESMYQLNENFDELQLPQHETTSKNINCLMDLVLENRESKAKDQMEFMKLPPLAALIPNKPIFLDLVWNFLEYKEIPESLAEVPKTAKKGFFGMFSRN